jgi:hypothetical protein
VNAVERNGIVGWAWACEDGRSATGAFRIDVAKLGHPKDRAQIRVLIEFGTEMRLQEPLHMDRRRSGCGSCGRRR